MTMRRYLYLNILKRANSTNISTNIDLKKLKSIDSIPGPITLPVFGTSWIYLPIVGYGEKRGRHQTAMEMFKKYGPIVREVRPNGKNVITLFGLEDIENFLTSEATSPERGAYSAVADFRRNRPYIYTSIGFLPQNGKAWEQMRSIFEIHSLLNPSFSESNAIIEEFIEIIIRRKKEIDILEYAYRVNLELLWVLLFGERLYCFDWDELESCSKTTKLINAVTGLNRLMLNANHHYEYSMEDKSHSHESCQRFLENIEIETLAAIIRMKERGDLKMQSCLAGKFLTLPSLNSKDAFCLIQDLIICGFDSISYTVQHLIHNLCKNEKSQERIMMEADCILSSDRVASTGIDEIASKYTRATIKETLRLGHLSNGIVTTSNCDMEISGYHIPIGTDIILDKTVANQLERNYRRAHEFIPERWLEEGAHLNCATENCSLSFGHAIGSCLAKNWAEQNIILFVLKVFHEFRANWTGSYDLRTMTTLVNSPDSMPKVSFHRRK